MEPRGGGAGGQAGKATEGGRAEPLEREYRRGEERRRGGVS